MRWVVELLDERVYEELAALPVDMKGPIPANCGIDPGVRAGADTGTFREAPGRACLGNATERA